MNFQQILEAVMVIMFGISWPLSILKHLKSKTAKGTSLPFLLFIEAGYISGVLSKIVGHNITYVFIFYCINLVMVSFDIVLYFINKNRDKVNNKTE